MNYFFCQFESLKRATPIHQVRLISYLNFFCPSSENSTMSCLSFHKTLPTFLIFLERYEITLIPFAVQFFSLLLFVCRARLGKNPASSQFQGIPTKCTWKFFFWLGGTGYNIIFSYFQNFWIFGANRLIFLDGGSINESTVEKLYAFWFSVVLSLLLLCQCPLMKTAWCGQNIR